MRIDGKKIADDILSDVKNDVASCANRLVLTVITCAPNFATKKFIEIKKGIANFVGVSLHVVELEAVASTQDCVAAIVEHESISDGIIVQLPFPEHIDTSKVLSAVPPSKDIDALNPLTEDVLAPVAGACKEILDRCDVRVKNNRALVVGDGKLVGRPVCQWLQDVGARVAQVTAKDSDIASETQRAEVIVLGAGVPGLLSPDMISEGVVILDAGTSESGGVIVGDADPACEEKASVFTPVPGGIGPITVAILFRNLVLLASVK